MENLNNTEEYPVSEIPLTGKILDQYAELSGMDWHGDDLIILPQYPHKLTDMDYGLLFSIPKEKIINFINGDTSVIEPDSIKFFSPGLEDYESWGSGYEAIAFDGDTVFLSIENVGSDKTEGIIVKGEFKPESSELYVNPEPALVIPGQSSVRGFAEEAITLVDNSIISFYEANGRIINPDAVAHKADKDLFSATEIPMLNIEYRITDATKIDAENKFWVMNYFWPGDADNILPADDSLFILFGRGKTHSQYDAVERLVELRYTGNEIVFAGSPPILFQLISDYDSRNWEGLVRLDQIGFLLVTDVYPRTILGFVKFPGTGLKSVACQ